MTSVYQMALIFDKKLAGVHERLTSTKKTLHIVYIVVASLLSRIASMLRNICIARKQRLFLAGRYRNIGLLATTSQNAQD